MSERIVHRHEIDELLSAWTRLRPARELAALLQRAGVPAGFMQRPDEYENDPHLQARDFLRTFEQPGLEPRRIEHAPFRSERIPPPENRPAPEPGEHTREICSGLLGMDDQTVEELLAAAVLEEPDAAAVVIQSRS
jgi:crotonobetainyl-CoA:carnitine CoA-transferase CaiB-like acyl-CoA transferase